jgi:anthranilate phosphoribosyltransferase
MRRDDPVPPSEQGPERFRTLMGELLKRQDLSEALATEAARALFSGELSDAQAAAILTGLAVKGESLEELRGFAQAMRESARPFPWKAPSAIDLCGTGGAPRPSFNISTVSAFVVAAGGLAVIKHGNVSARGPCGSSDLLTALGLPIQTSRAYSEESFRRENIAFLHAPLYHPLMKRLAPVRRALGFRTIFNQLGPLSNPARPPRQVVGAFSAEYASRAPSVLRRLGCERVLAFHSEDDADEPSPQARTWMRWEDATGTHEGWLEPARYLEPEEQRGGWDPLPPREAAYVAERVLAGDPGAIRGAVLLTAGLAFWVGGDQPTIEEGVKKARRLIDGGRAQEKLDALRGLARERSWEE